MSKIKLSLPEAAEAVADLFAGNPELYATDTYFTTDTNPHIFDMPEGDAINRVESFCAVGGVALAAGVGITEARDFLRPFAGEGCPEYQNNRGRRHAIAMLKRAAQA